MSLRFSQRDLQFWLLKVSRGIDTWQGKREQCWEAPESQEKATASCSTINPDLSSASFLFQTTPSSGLEKHSCALIYHLFFFKIKTHPSSKAPSCEATRTRASPPGTEQPAMYWGTCIPALASLPQGEASSWNPADQGLRNCPFILSDLYYYSTE